MPLSRVVRLFSGCSKAPLKGHTLQNVQTQANSTTVLALGTGAVALVGAAAYTYAWMRPKQITRYAYIHGFASSPKAMKGQLLKSTFGEVGLPFELPDMNQPSASNMTCSASLQELDRMHAEAQSEHKGAVRWCLVGSSMGGYLAARWAELHPDQVQRLVLMSPAFDFPKVIEGIMEPKGSRLSEWESKGVWSFHGLLVDWCMISDYLKHPAEPEVLCPTMIIHGRQDSLVPIEIARSYAKSRSGRVELVELDDDHLLADSMPIMVPLISKFFDIKPDLTPPTPPSKSGVSQFDSTENT